MSKGFGPLAAFVSACGLIWGTAAEARNGYEFGYQFASRFADSNATRSLPYAEAWQEWNWEGYGSSAWSLKTGARLAGEFRDPNHLEGTSELSIRELALSFNKDIVRIQAGFQEIPWGESFGFQIADLVNPRDWRDPLFLDSNWVRLPVCALQGQLFLGKLTLQAVWTPVPRNNQLPTAGTAFDPSVGVTGAVRPALDQPTDFLLSNFGRDSEFGGHASYLFDSGVDLGVFALYHWTRTPVYQVTTNPRIPSAPIRLTPVVDRETTLGLNFSDSIGGWVVRMDSVFHMGQPLLQANTGVVVQNGKQSQTVVGADWTPDGSNWTFGAQYQNETDLYPATTLNLNWFSLRTQVHFLGDKLESEVFLFGGIDTADFWVQPKLTWNINPSWAISGRVDWVKGGALPDAGYLATASDQSRFLFWLTYKL